MLKGHLTALLVVIAAAVHLAPVAGSDVEVEGHVDAVAAESGLKVAVERCVIDAVDQGLLGCFI